MAREFTSPYLSDQPEGMMIRFICKRCGRSGRYRKETLLARFGDVCMPDLRVKVANCEHSGNYSSPCGISFNNGGPDYAREAAATLPKARR